MKRKLLCILVLYVLGVAFVQNMKCTVVSTGRDACYAALPDEFTDCLAGKITGFSETENSHVIYMQVQCASASLGVACYVGTLQAEDVLDGAMDLCIGDFLSVSGSFSKPEVPTNPGQFNQYVYYRSRGLDLLCRPSRIIQLHAAKSRKKNIGQVLYSCKCRLARVYDGMSDSCAGGVLKAMLLGDKSGLSRELSSLYQKNNISHILSISGLHMGLICGMLYGLLRMLGCSYTVAGITGIMLAFGYGAMTGAADAAMRAAIMLAVSMVGAMLGRTYDLLTAMGISLAVLVTLHPLKLYDAGFLFSFGAVLGIGSVYPCLSGMCRAVREKKKNAKKGIVPGAAKMKKPALKQSLLFSLSIQLVTLPISLYFYGTAAPYALLLNILVIPFMTPILLLGLAGGVLGVLSPVAAVLPLKTAAIMICAITRLARFVSHLPGFSVILGAMDWWQILIYYVCLVLLCFLYINGKMNCCLLFLWGVMFFMLIYRIPVNRFVMFDVGQGSSMLLQTRSGLHILVDGGSTSESGVGEYMIAPALKHYGIRSLDFIIITHADEDHINGVYHLLEEADSGGVGVKALLMPKLCKDMEAYQKLKETADSHGVRIAYLTPGMTLTDAEIKITCMHPSLSDTWDNLNDMSAVLSVCYGDTKLLLTGDISEEAEEKLYRYKALLANTDILQVAHHGSKYSTSMEFLRWVSPETALISCGKKNRYGHPHKELMDRLDSVGCKVRMTAREGAIIYKFE